MRPRKIKENIYWLGAVDWDRRLFDSLISLSLIFGILSQGKPRISFSPIWQSLGGSLLPEELRLSLRLLTFSVSLTYGVQLSCLRPVFI